MDKLPAGTSLAEAKKITLREIGVWVTPVTQPENIHSTGTTRLSMKERLCNADGRIEATV